MHCFLIPHHLPAAVTSKLKPIFKRSTNSVLLSKCLRSATQNVNDLVNASIWKILPRDTFLMLEIFKFGVYTKPLPYSMRVIFQRAIFFAK